MRIYLRLIVQCRFVATIICGATLIGCSTLFESDNQALPAPLTDYKPTLTIKTLWSRDVGAGSAGQSLRLIPASAKGMLFIADRKGQVETLDIASGKTIWRIDTKAPITSGPGLGYNRILLGTSKAQVIALKIDNGQELWRASVSNEVIAVPKISEDIVVVHTIDGRLYGLKSSTGERKWVYDRSEPALSLRGNSSPILDSDHDTIIAGLSNGVLVDLSLATGEPRWEVVVTQPQGRSELERIVDIDSDPVIQDGVIYTATYQGEVAAIDQTTGVALWRRKMSVYRDLASDKERLYVVDADSRVWALDLHNGAALWQQKELLNRQLTAPAILNQYILVGDRDGYVHWLSRSDGSQQGGIRVDSSPISTPPVVIDGVAYLYSDDGTLTAIAASLPNAAGPYTAF